MSRKPNLELLPPWGSAVAGATGAILANAAVYPLDIVKTRLQVQVKSKPEDILSTVDSEPYYTSTSDAIAKIISEEGLGGLYSGIHGSLIGVASTNFAYFYWYTTLRNLYTSSQKNMRPPSASAELALGALAGAIAQIFTIPVSVVTTRQQTQSKGQKKGLFETGKEVIESEDGYSGLWRGLRASLVLVVNPAITYGAYQRLNNLLFQGKSRLRPWESFFLGAVSKACATVLTQPLIVAKVGLQSKPPPSRGDRPFQTFIEVMRYIVQREGLLGLFKGIGPQIMKGVIVQGLLMMTKDRLEIIFSFIFHYVRQMKFQKIKEISEIVAGKGKLVSEYAPPSSKMFSFMTK